MCIVITCYLFFDVINFVIGLSFLIKPFSYMTKNLEQKLKYLKNQSSRLKVFCIKSVLRNFAKFTGKHLCQSLFFNKIAGVRPATLLKKVTLAHVFYCEFCEISKNTFFTEHFWTTASVKTWLNLSNNGNCYNKLCFSFSSR